jgi:hypothetical protein
MDWAARLDSKGYHKVSISPRPLLFVRRAGDWDEVMEWNDTKQLNECWVVGKEIEVCESNDFSSPYRIAVGDVVYLTGVAKGKPAEIQLVTDLFEDARESSKNLGKIWMGSTAFWRPERLKIPDKMDWHLKELFIAQREGELLSVDNDPSKFLELTRVRADRVLSASLPADIEEFGDHQYFYRTGFDPKTGVTEAASGGEAAEAAAEEAGAAEAAGTVPTADDGAGGEHPPPKRAKPNEVLKARVAALEADVCTLKAQLRLFEDMFARVRQLEALSAGSD